MKSFIEDSHDYHLVERCSKCGIVQLMINISKNHYLDIFYILIVKLWQSKTQRDKNSKNCKRERDYYSKIHENIKKYKSDN